MEIDDKHEKMNAINEEVWSLINKYNLKTSDDVMLTSAVLLKCAVQLYTVVLEDDDIEEILTGHAVDSIPSLREIFQDVLTRKLH